MLGKRAKILSDNNIRDLLAFTTHTRYPLRNRVIVLLSTKAGLRAGEIANLTWPMITDSTDEIGTVIALEDQSRKKEQWPGHSLAPGLGRCAQDVAAYDRRRRPSDYVRARRADDAAVHRELVHDRLSGDWGYRVLVPFGAANVRHPGSTARR